MDPFHAPPIAPRLREPLRAALRGELTAWPSDLTTEETMALLDHGLAPLVYATVALPALRAAAIRAAAVEPLRQDDLRVVLGALASNSVETLILKGTALAYDLYAAPELRPRADVDLLVAQSDATAAIDTFRTLGFSMPHTSGDEHAVRQVTLTRRDAYGFEHDYDLHWDVTNTPVFASVLRFDALQKRARLLPRLGPHAQGLSDADALLLACIHRVAHHHDTERLIWLVDIALLRRRMSEDDHRRFWRQAADARVAMVCSRSIELADEWMSSATAHTAEQWLTVEERSRDEPSRVYLDRNLRYGEEMLADFRALPWRARMQRLWQLAFPPAAFLQESFGTRSRLALPWLYVRRSVRGVARLFKRV